MSLFKVRLLGRRHIQCSDAHEGDQEGTRAGILQGPGRRAVQTEDGVSATEDACVYTQFEYIISLVGNLRRDLKRGEILFDGQQSVDGDGEVI